MKYFFFLNTFLLLTTAIIAQEPTEAILYGRWNDPSLVASSAHNNIYNEVYSIYNENGEYAVIGSTAGTHIIDVTNPKNPKQIHFVKGKAVGNNIIHRDYKKYKNFLFAVCDEGASSLQVIDYSGLPDSIKVVYDNDSLIITTHNIFIDTAQARLYACYSRNAQGFNPLKVYDISDPTKPKFLAKYNSIDGYDLNFGGVHDAYVKNNLAYLNAGRGLAIVDFSNVNDPVLLTGITDYPDAGYNHSGWLSDDENYYYMADETHGYDLKTFDVSDIPDVKVTSVFNANSTTNFSIPHNPYVKGDYLYVAYYFDGLQVYDIKDRSTPKRILKYPTSTIPVANGLYRGAWGVNPDLPSGLILVADMQNGLFVFEPVEKTLTGNKNIQFDFTTLYPNPASEFICLPELNEIDKSKIFITDVLGNKLQSHFDKDKLLLSNFTNGIYFLKYGNYTSKFIISK